MPEHIIVLCACGSKGEAEAIAHRLVELRLAACVNITAVARSIYRWQGKVESTPEWLLTIKSTGTLFPQISQAIEELHSYELPEIVALPMAAGSPAYLKWIGDSVHE